MTFARLEKYPMNSFVSLSHVLSQEVQIVQKKEEKAFQTYASAKGLKMIESLLPKIQNLFHQTLSSIPATALNDEKTLFEKLPKDVEQLTKAQKDVNDYFKQFGPGDREDRESLLTYWSTYINTMLPLAIPLLSSITLKQFIAPITAQHITEHMTDEHIEQLKTAGPNMLHNILWTSLAKYRKHMADFRDFLVQLDQLPQAEFEAFKKNVQDNQSDDSTLLEQYAKFISIGPYFENILKAFLEMKK